MDDDPPVRLRRFLEYARAERRPFTAVWGAGVNYAVRDIPDHRYKHRWKSALGGTWRVWKSAYERTGTRLMLTHEMIEYLNVEESRPESRDKVLA